MMKILRFINAYTCLKFSIHIENVEMRDIAIIIRAQLHCISRIFSIQLKLKWALSRLEIWVKANFAIFIVYELVGFCLINPIAQFKPKDFSHTGFTFSNFT